MISTACVTALASLSSLPRASASVSAGAAVGCGDHGGEATATFDAGGVTSSVTWHGTQHGRGARDTCGYGELD